MKVKKRVLGPEHPETLTSMGNLAMAYWNQGRWREAEELQAKEFEICQKVLGEEHPDTLTSMTNLAFIFKGQGRNEEAMALMKDCTRMRKQVLGPDHPFTTSSQDLLNEWGIGNLDLNPSDARGEPDR
jgi:hypothetical protein